eukprot:COSAG05_NODE_1985_length_3744_cov_2.083676_4_plen_111_part_00
MLAAATQGVDLRAEMRTKTSRKASAATGISSSSQSVRGTQRGRLPPRRRILPDARGTQPRPLTQRKHSAQCIQDRRCIASTCVPVLVILLLACTRSFFYCSLLMSMLSVC